MNDAQVKAVVVMDTSSVDAAFDRVGDKADQMAQKVTAAAGKAGKATDGIGDGAGKGAEKFTRAESRITDSIKRSTQELNLLGKTASEKLEFKIADKGLNASKFAPYLAELKKAEAAQLAIATGAVAAGSAGTKALNNMGMSAKATAAALRGVPAQFTDIAVSLQGGQKPLTVLLQQGGQLKDMFGGVGNAARALGGYVLGLVNPFTILAATLGAVAYGYYTGSQEASEFSKALILSGNAAGATTSQLSDMAASVAKVTGTRGAAAAALTEFAKSGAVAADNLVYFSTAALKFEKATGTAIKETVKQFEELKKSPLEASLKLNESTNYLTESLYRQIKALEEQGRTIEAAQVAQKAYADTINSRASEIVGNLGLFERGWNGVAAAAKGALDIIKGIGRDTSPGDKIAAAQAEYDRLKRPGATTRRGLNLASPVRDSDIESARANLDALKEVERLSGKVAANRAAEAAQVKALSEYDKLTAKSLTDKQKLEAEILVIRNKGLAAGLSEKKIQEDVNALIASRTKKGSASKPKSDEAARELSEYVKRLEAATGKTLELTEAQKALDFLKGLGVKGEVPQVRELVLGLAERIDKEKELGEQIKLRRQLSIEESEAVDKANKAYQERLKGLLDATPTAILEKQRDDVKLLTEEYKASRLSEELYLEAVTARLNLVNDKTERASDLAKDLGLSFSSAFEDAIVGGKGLKDVLKGLEQDILRIITRKLVTEPAGDALTGLIKGFTSGGGNPLASIFGGARAAGGPVLPGQAYLVGERGPEIIMPKNAGTVLPNGTGMGNVVNLVINQSFAANTSRATTMQAASDARRQLEYAGRNL